MSTVTKKDLIDRLASRHNIARADVKAVLQGLLEEITEELAEGNRLEFRDFGVFEVRVSAARKAKNPKTRESVYVPPRQTVKFKPGRQMRQRVEAPLEKVVAHGDDGAVGEPAPTGVRGAAG